MLFSSYSFLFLFLPVTVIGYHILAGLKLSQLSRYWLVLASIFFYGSGEIEFLWLLAGSIVFNFCLGAALLAMQDDSSGHRRKSLLVAGVTVNLGALAWFKYRGFIGDVVGALTDTGLHLGEIILPLGISFFTFQQIAYLVDAARGKVPRTGFLNYTLFVTFFPQLVAGPIVHHAEMLPQFSQAGRATRRWEFISLGITAFVIGLFKKVVIADSIAGYATTVFAAADAGGVPTLYSSWAATAAYTFQIYFDFSGYSDMAIGLGYLFGIRLPVNFLSPYKATNMIDFWRRWHITLSRFLRDYLYIPLGGNRFGKAMRYRNLMLTMLLGGLWHGAGWTFLIWGGLHGLYLALNHLWQDHVGGQTAAAEQPSGWATGLHRWLARGLTLYLVALAWVFFRAESFSGAMTMVSAMHGFQGLSLAAPFGRIESALWLIGLWAVVWWMPNTTEVLQLAESGPTQRQARDQRPVLDVRWQPTFMWSAAVAAMAVVSISMISRGGEFIYYHF